jgi:hypothetical protein
MGEPVHCRITIRTPDTWKANGKIPWFVDQILEEMYEFTDITIDDHPDQNATEYEVQGCLNYGIGDNDTAAILEVLRELGVPFETHQESTPEWGEEMELFDGTESYNAMTVSDWPVLEHTTWQAIKREAGDAITRIITITDEWFTHRQRRLNECSIEHLGHLCPPDPDDRQLAIDNILGVPT